MFWAVSWLWCLQGSQSGQSYSICKTTEAQSTEQSSNHGLALWGPADDGMWEEAWGQMRSSVIWAWPGLLKVLWTRKVSRDLVKMQSWCRSGEAQRFCPYSSQWHRGCSASSHNLGENPQQFRESGTGGPYNPNPPRVPPHTGIRASWLRMVAQSEPALLGCDSVGTQCRGSFWDDPANYADFWPKNTWDFKMIELLMKSEFSLTAFGVPCPVWDYYFQYW